MIYIICYFNKTFLKVSAGQAKTDWLTATDIHMVAFM